MSETGRQLTIEVTDEMIIAAKRELLRVDFNFSTPTEAAERLLEAALVAGRFEVRLKNCAHP